jgi:hypothetical protein
MFATQPAAVRRDSLTIGLFRSWCGPGVGEQMAFELGGVAGAVGTQLLVVACPADSVLAGGVQVSETFGLA